MQVFFYTGAKVLAIPVLSISSKPNGYIVTSFASTKIGEVCVCLECFPVFVVTILGRDPG